MKKIAVLCALGLTLSLTACSKTETTTQSDSLTTATEAAQSGAHNSGMDHSSDPASHGGSQEMGDMQKMGEMMMTKLGSADQNYDQRFIEMMIPHHEGALLMAKDAIGKTSKPELKALAESMLKGQKAEVDKMTAWENKWYSRAPQTSSEMEMMNQSMAQKLAPAGSEYEDSFIDQMIPHHESAIAMAKDALQKASHPELKTLAQSIITEQQAEIDKMKDLRKKWYGH